jgi:hypothetical protein
MNGKQFDAAVRTLASRRGVVRFAGMGLLGAAGLVAPTIEAKQRANDRKRKRRRRRRRNRDRVLPVFSTCHTATQELGPIPGGPYPTCHSRYDPDEFVPCDTRYTFNDLKQMCEDAFPECAGDCRVLSEPTVGLGDCPDFVYCNWQDANCFPHTAGKIPGGPYGSCWSWWNPFMTCWSCPGATPDFNGMVEKCSEAYQNECRYAGRQICHPDASDYPSDRQPTSLPSCPT